MTQALVSVLYAKKRKIPHILYVTDLWPENVVAVTGIHNRLIIGPVQKMVDYIYNRSTYILTSSKSFIRAIKNRKISEDKLEFWPQYAEDFYKPTQRVSESEIPDDGVCNLVFAGNIGFAQGLGILPKAAAKLRDEGVFVRFVIIGDGRYMPTLRKEISDFNAEDYFYFIDRKPAEEIPAYLAAADALLITLSKNEVFSITIPAKTQSCLACGRPIIVSADGEVQQIIKDSKAGLVSDSEDVDGFVNNVIAISKMKREEREELGKNALAYSKSNFDKEELLTRVDQILQGGFNGIS
jgi:glycosyltransferase involved in cell wall biosynthesis